MTTIGRMLWKPGAAGLRLLRMRGGCPPPPSCPALPEWCPKLPGCRPPLPELTAWDNGDGSREGGDSSPDGISIEASMPMGVGNLLLASCPEVCTGSPGRDPMGPNRLLEKPCKSETYLSQQAGVRACLRSHTTKSSLR